MTVKPDAEYDVGDRVVCTGDEIDGSWEGEEGEIVKVYWQEGGVFAGARWVYVIRWDVDGDARDDEDLDTSDTFEIEPA